jgi:ABC-type antimicrobial peptide transport system permease subunit
MVGTLQVGDAPPPTDATPIIVGGLVVLVVSVVAIAYATRRASKKPKSP